MSAEPRKLQLVSPHGALLEAAGGELRAAERNPFGYSARLLGRPRLNRHGRPLPTPIESRSLAILYYLLRQHGRPVTRAELAALLWPAHEAGPADAQLQRAFDAIERVFPDLVLVDHQQARANLARIDRIDANELELVGQAPDAVPDPVLHQLLNGWQGPFLDAVAVAGAARFDAWLRAQREHLRALAGAIAAEAARRIQTASPASRLSLGERWVQIESANEVAHRFYMQALAGAGRPVAAIEHFRQLSARLHEALGTSAEPETIALAKRLLPGLSTHATSRLDLEPVPSDDSVTRAAPAPTPTRTEPIRPADLRGEADEWRERVPLVGRVRELDEIDRRLRQPDCRLMTLVGPGGIGKTRLSMAVAKRLGEPTTQVSLLGLEPGDAGEAIDALALQIGQSLGFAFKAPDSPAALLLNHLQSRHGLLLIDNFETFLPAAPYVQQLLARAPAIRVLVTSRERLGCPEEWVFDVPGLSGGDADGPGEAFRLFVSVAGRVSPKFDPDANREAIERIVEAVDGSPLGIELAANWVRVLPCAEIARRVTSDLDLLTATGNAIDRRHRSMRTVLDSSWALLEPAAQQAFAGLCVFHGGCLADAAQEVIGADPMVLAALAERSWIKPQIEGNSVRYQVHPLLRQYGVERLASIPGMQEQCESAHAAYFRDHLLALTGRFGRFDVSREIRQDPDRANLQAAARWLLPRSEAMELAAFIGALHTYYLHAGRLGEAVSLLEQALAMPGQKASLAMYWQRLLAQDQWQRGRLRRCAEHARAVLSLAGDKLAEAAPGARWPALVDVGCHLLGIRRDRSAPVAAHQEVDRIFALARLSAVGFLSAESPLLLLRYALRANEVSRQGDVPAGQLWSCAFLGILLRAMHLNGVADRYGRRAAGLVDAVGNDSLSALALHMFGIESFIAARWDLSQDMMNRSARCYATTGEWRLTMDAAAINSLACIARGATDEARELSRRVIEGGRQHGDRITELWGWLEQAEADLREGMAPAPEALSEAGRLSDAGTVHEQLRLLAARAQAAWLARDATMAREDAQRALALLGRSRYLPFYDGEASCLVAQTLIELRENAVGLAADDAAALVAESDRAVAIARRLARANRFMLARAALLQGRLYRLQGRTADATRAIAFAQREAKALGQRIDQAAAQTLADQG
ncbi:MAG: BTAD domain-containing putative transcriptional regulator [Burkholderiaceae bacterium]